MGGRLIRANRRPSAYGFDPELIELPKAADGFWSGVEIKTNGLRQESLFTLLSAADSSTVVHVA